MSDLMQQLLALRPAMAAAAQEEYDAWQPDPEEGDPTCGFGGICDRIANAIGDIIVGSVQADITEGGAQGDDHAWVIVYDADQAIGVDINPGVYETGGGYSWQKIPDVTITPDDVEVFDTGIDPTEFSGEYD